MSKELDGIINTIVEANYAGKIKSIAVVFIDTDMVVKQSLHIPSEMLLATLGAIQIINYSVSQLGTNIVPPKDYLT